MGGNDGRFWRSWVLANALAEAVGLGGAFALGYALISAQGASEGGVAVLTMAALAIGLGTLEGAIVGFAQGLVLHRALPAIAPVTWAVATASGAFAAWVLGVLPSVLMDVAQPVSAAPAEDMPDYLNFVFAVVLGAVTGPILAAAQWVVLRRHVAGAWRWLPANAAAWMVGMPVVFLAPMRLTEGMAIGSVVALCVATTAAAGGIVGAVHGYALIRYLLPGATGD